MNPLISKLSIRHGLFIGGVSAVLSIVYYIINPVLQYTNLWIGLFSIALVITLLVVLSIDVRKKIGGFWNFGQAYVSLLIMSVCISLIGIILMFIINKFVDPSMPQKINDATLQTTTQTLEKWGADQGKIDESTKQFSDGEFLEKMQPTIVNTALNFVKALALYAIIDLIIAACVKKKPPMFAAVSDDEVVE